MDTWKEFMFHLFIGNSPADELKILQNQVSLLHIQLQYERHRCQLQVIRNRRLVGKIQKSGDLGFENDNLVSTISILKC